VREIADVAPPGSAYCGAVSLPYVLALSGDILVARPHPNLADRWSTERRSADLDAAPLAADRLCAAELDLDVPTDARVGVELSGHGLVVAVADGLTLATGHGGILLAMPLPRGAARHRVRLVFDADIVEVVVDGVAGSGAGRLPTGRWESVRVRGSGAGVLRTLGVAAGRAPEGPRPTTGT
jgi:hypothetical protein